MNSDIVYWSIDALKKHQLLAPLHLKIQDNLEQVNVISMQQGTLSSMQEDQRIELIESLTNIMYPLYFYIQMPDIYLEEFELLFNTHQNEYAIAGEIETNYFLTLKVQDCANLKIIIKEVAWLNGSGYKLLWSTSPTVFNSQGNRNGDLLMGENHSIFMIGEPEDSLIIITNEHRFNSFEKLKELLPSFVVPTLYEHN